ncbi:MAG: flagellar basal body rod protein [Fibrobacter sp.]|nr:flagellar basal body rod protein [Fibrobacter sp.]
MTTSFNAPLSGLAAAALSQDITANNIANISTPGYKEKRAIQSESATSGTFISSVQTTDKEPDLAGSMVDLSINKNTYTANLKVIKAQDGMLGTLLDIIR